MIVQYLDLHARINLSLACKKFNTLGLTYKDISYSDSANNRIIQYDLRIQCSFRHMIKCFTNRQPLPKIITDRISYISHQLKFENCLRHLLCCGDQGCFLCKRTQQWEEIIGSNMYSEYFINMSEQTGSRDLSRIHSFMYWMNKQSVFSDFHQKNYLTFLHEFMCTGGYQYDALNYSARIRQKRCMCSTHGSDKIDSKFICYCCVVPNDISVAVYIIQNRIFLNTIALPYYVSLAVEHYYNKSLDSCRVVPSTDAVYTCECYKSNLIPITIFLWSCSVFYNQLKVTEVFNLQRSKFLRYYNSIKTKSYSLPVLKSRSKHYPQFVYYYIHTASGAYCSRTTKKGSELMCAEEDLVAYEYLSPTDLDTDSNSDTESNSETESDSNNENDDN